MTFLTRTHTDHSASLLRDRGFGVIDMAPQLEHSRNIGTWLGAPPKIDVAETVRALEGLGGVHWLVVDHYGIGAAWHRAARAATRRVLVIDDLKDRYLDAEIVLNQNLGSTVTDYMGLVAPATKVLAGPRFALLAAKYRTARAQQNRCATDTQRGNLLISLGGSDPSDNTGRVLAELEPVLQRFARVDVVVSRHHPGLRAFHARWLQRASVHVHVQPASLVSLLSTADIAIGAGGSATWERMCLGVPSVMLVLAENQRDLARAVAELELGIVCEAPWSATAGIRAVTVGLLKDTARQRRMAEAGLQMVDGEGTSRVADAMEEIEQ